MPKEELLIYFVPAAGYCIGWLSWLNWSVTVGMELLTVSIFDETFALVIIISLAFVPDQRMALYCGIPFIVACYVYYHLVAKRRMKEIHRNQTINAREGARA